MLLVVQRRFSEDQVELMDLPSVDEAALRQDLHNLEKINRYFGGRTAVLRLLARVMGKKSSATIIDLATGFGDHPRSMHRWAENNGRMLRVIAVDFQVTTLKLARAATPSTDQTYFIQADIRRLPFKPEVCDWVFCNLALHHFSEKDAVQILQESQRVMKQGAVCLDLIRSRLAYVAVWLLTALWMREPMTRHDARLSVWRAFSGDELKRLAQRAGWASFSHLKLPWFRQAIIKMKRYGYE